MNTSWKNVIPKKYLINTLATKRYVWLLRHNIGQFVSIDTSLKKIIPRISYFEAVVIFIKFYISSSCTLVRFKVVPWLLPLLFLNCPLCFHYRSAINQFCSKLTIVRFLSFQTIDLNRSLGCGFNFLQQRQTYVFIHRYLKF